MKFFHEVLLAPSMCLFRWINRIISKRAHTILKILFILGLNKFLACLECVRSYAWSFGHSDPDPSSVDHLPIPSCQRSFWMTPNANFGSQNQQRRLRKICKSYSTSSTYYELLRECCNSLKINILSPVSICMENLCTFQR